MCGEVEVVLGLLLLNTQTIAVSAALGAACLDGVEAVIDHGSHHNNVVDVPWAFQTGDNAVFVDEGRQQAEAHFVCPRGQGHVCCADHVGAVFVDRDLIDGVGEVDVGHGFTRAGCRRPIRSWPAG